MYFTTSSGPIHQSSIPPERARESFGVYNINSRRFYFWLHFVNSWEDDRGAEQIIADIKKVRKKSSSKLVKGFDS